MSTSGAAPAPILTEAELKLLQALVYQECGMHFDERRTHFLQDRLLRRIKECRAGLHAHVAELLNAFEVVYVVGDQQAIDPPDSTGNEHVTDDPLAGLDGERRAGGDRGRVFGEQVIQLVGFGHAIDEADA